MQALRPRPWICLAITVWDLEVCFGEKLETPKLSREFHFAPNITYSVLILWLRSLRRRRKERRERRRWALWGWRSCPLQTCTDGDRRKQTAMGVWDRTASGECGPSRSGEAAFPIPFTSSLHCSGWCVFVMGMFSCVLKLTLVIFCRYKPFTSFDSYFVKITWNLRN